MNHPADTDTTAHRYFRPVEIAELAQALDRAFARLLRDPVPEEWHRLSQDTRLRWVAMIEEYRRGATPKQVYESLSGYQWSELERDDQIRMEIGHLLVTMLGTMQR